MAAGRYPVTQVLYEYFVSSETHGQRNLDRTKDEWERCFESYLDGLSHLELLREIEFALNDIDEKEAAARKSSETTTA